MTPRLYAILAVVTEIDFWDSVLHGDSLGNPVAAQKCSGCREMLTVRNLKKNVMGRRVLLF